MLGSPNRRKRKECIFCKYEVELDYKDKKFISHFVSLRGKILSRKATGTCAKHQRKLAAAVKRARHIALLPFVKENLR